MPEQQPKTVLDLYKYLTEYRQKYLAQLSKNDPEAVSNATEEFDRTLGDFLRISFEKAINSQNSELILVLSRLMVWWRNHLNPESVSFDTYPEVLRVVLTELGLNWNSFATLLDEYPIATESEAETDPYAHVDAETRTLIDEWLNSVSFYPQGLEVKEPVVLFGDLRKVLDMSPGHAYYFLTKFRKHFKIAVENLPLNKPPYQNQNGMSVSDAQIALYKAVGKYFKMEI